MSRRPRSTPKPPAPPLATLPVLRWAHGGDAVAMADDGPLAGLVVFVRGAVPGDVVRVAVETKKKRWARARLVAVERPSPERRVPPCAVQAACGGCPWMVGTREAQRASREAILLGEVRKSLIPGLTSDEDLAAKVRLVDVAGASEVGYRVRAKLAWRRGPSGAVAVGFMGKASHAFVPIPRCEVLTPALNDALPAIRRALAAEAADRGEVTLVAGDEGVAAWVEPTPGPGHPVGPEQVTVRFGARPFTASPRAFLQANAAVAGALVDRVEALARELGGAHAVELFAGAGLFTTALWAAGFAVDAYEVDPAARAGFEATRERLGVPAERGRWHASDLLLSGVPSPRPAAPPDLVLLDPPRAGAAELVPWIRASGARAVILVSCDVATAARDLALLAEGPEGFEVTRVDGYDMFPHTGHQEVLAVCVRRGVPTSS
ncbi:MAG: class I SAM-dependent RNA methyltransferase [Deltaproteobacteria bacterium]|nr:class I SAM-dependent RNA methyltransferase [Deltaproteobacteria bacterium]